VSIRLVWILFCYCFYAEIVYLMLQKHCRAYRNMSLKFHPDKNPGNKLAENMFMNIAKAYEALTDPVAKENYRLYGNPDGKQSLEVSIGLPTFLLDRANRNLVLLMYLIIMVGVIPYFVWRYYSNSSKYGENNIMYDTYSWFYHALSKEIGLKNIPEVFAGAAEFRQSNRVLKEEGAEIRRLLDEVKGSMQKPTMSHHTLLKGNVLLHKHLLRNAGDLSSKHQSALELMLKNSTSLMEAMISICRNQDYLNATMNCIEFQQYLTQALWTNASPYAQLPHLSESLTKGVESFSDFLALAPDKQSDVLDENDLSLTKAQREDISAAVDIMPKISFETRVFVDDDEDDDIYEGDLLTILVTLKRSEKAKLVYAPYFPYPKNEAWWIILGNSVDGRILHVDKVTKSDTVVEHRIKMQAPKQGTYNFTLQFKSNAYIGLDCKDEITVTTLDASKLPQYKIHPDDAELDDEPTLFEEMMAANVEKDESDDEDDSDDESGDDSDSEEEDGIRELSAAEMKKKALKEQRKGDDESDSESDVEEVHAE